MGKKVKRALNARAEQAKTWASSCARGQNRCVRSARDLVFFFLPDVVRALSPAVRAAFVNATLTFNPVKESTPAHKQTLNTLMALLSH